VSKGCQKEKHKGEEAIGNFTAGLKLIEIVT
jgi:hypothetical protein